MSRILLHLDGVINVGMDRGAEKLTQAMYVYASNYLKGKLETNTGNLLGSFDVVTVKKAGAFSGMARYDLVVDKKKAPYVFWIEFGRMAPVGLPYSNVTGKNKKDFRLSRFSGYWFMNETLKFFSKSPITGNLILGKIALTIRQTDSIMKMKKM